MKKKTLKDNNFVGRDDKSRNENYICDNSFLIKSVPIIYAKRKENISQKKKLKIVTIFKISK